MNSHTFTRRLAATATASGLMAMSCLSSTMLTTAGAETSSCGTDEVTVVVAGEGEGCAKDGATGLEALDQAGFEVTPVSSMPGMICQINGAPENADCSKAPEMDAFWGYYTAPLGGEWAFSQKGANEQIAKAGTVEGWAFGNSAQPGEVPEAGNKQNDDDTVIEEEKSENVWLPNAGVIVVLLALVGLAMYFVRKRNSRRTV